MNVILVFGSNTRGIHGKGAALFAARYYGAERFVGEGPTGQAYALPTKDAFFRTRPLAEIEASVRTLLAYAATHPELLFKVTRVGCGLAGLTNEQVAPMFKGAPANCGFDPEWAPFGLKTWAEVGISD